MANVELGQVVRTPETFVNLEKLSDGELLELAVSSETPTESRRLLVVWLYLKEPPGMGLEQFDQSLTASAERELERRAKRG